MVYAETLLDYPDCRFRSLCTHASDKHLVAVISQHYKPIDLFSIKLIKPYRNYTMTEKELISIVECLNQFRGIIFGYKINVYSDHKNLVYAATQSESQRLFCWRIIPKDFEPNI